jgi:hypothetical protein
MALQRPPEVKFGLPVFDSAEPLLHSKTQYRQVARETDKPSLLRHIRTTGPEDDTLLGRIERVKTHLTALGFLCRARVVPYEVGLYPDPIFNKPQSPHYDEYGPLQRPPIVPAGYLLAARVKVIRSPLSPWLRGWMNPQINRGVQDHRILIHASSRGALLDIHAGQFMWGHISEPKLGESARNHWYINDIEHFTFPEDAPPQGVILGSPDQALGL